MPGTLKGNLKGYLAALLALAVEENRHVGILPPLPQAWMKIWWRGRPCGLRSQHDRKKKNETRENYAWNPKGEPEGVSSNSLAPAVEENRHIIKDRHGYHQW